MTDLSHYRRFANFQGKTHGVDSTTSETPGHRVVITITDSFILNYPNEGHDNTDRQLVYAPYAGSPQLEQQVIHRLNIEKDDESVVPAQTMTYRNQTFVLVESSRGTAPQDWDDLESDKEYHLILKGEGGNGDDLHLLYSSYADTC